jgi:hypothetical protein
MKVSIWDTYVHKKDGEVMHFDIIASDSITDENIIYEMGKKYLQTKNMQDFNLSAKQCSFCHHELASEEMESSIINQGYYIVEMEGCE